MTLGTFQQQWSELDATRFPQMSEFLDFQLWNLLDFYEHVCNAEGQRSRHVNQEERVHARQQHAAQAWNDATQTAYQQTNKRGEKKQKNKTKQD